MALGDYFELHYVLEELSKVIETEIGKLTLIHNTSC
jgi:hypothetical protein